MSRTLSDSSASRLKVRARLRQIATRASKSASGALMTHPRSAALADGPSGEVKLVVDGIERCNPLPQGACLLRQLFACFNRDS